MKNLWNNLRCLIVNQLNNLTIDLALTKLFNKIQKGISTLVDSPKVFMEEWVKVDYLSERVKVESVTKIKRLSCKTL